MIASPDMTDSNTERSARTQGQFLHPAGMNVVLVNPLIPPNTGNVARLCAVTASKLHLIAPLGFSIADKDLRRAGLDYWDKVFAATYASFDELLAENRVAPEQLHLFTGRAKRGLWEARFRPGDFLVLGEEQKGLPEALLERFPDRTVRVPMIAEPSARSLNLSTCTGVVLYEALRQTRPEPE
jgi:tRNA (cytidine/uridine-2'-O-)-methyltransferase